VLDQVSPDVFLVSSKADDKFIDLCSDSSMDFLGRQIYAPQLSPCSAVDASGGFFQIRPQKDFRPERGRNNILSLELLSDLPQEILDPSNRETSTEPKNAYEFMRRRRNTEGNPTLRRWNASVRMSNFVSLDMSPFAVGSVELFLRESLL
jgi:DNA mismatch repair protein MSH5